MLGIKDCYIMVIGQNYFNQLVMFDMITYKYLKNS